jgi:hypothetical protein
MSLVWLSSARLVGAVDHDKVPVSGELTMAATASAARAVRNQQTGFMVGI